MNLADELRKEMGSKKLPDWFKDEVVSNIKCFGRSSFICDRHIRDVSRGAFPMKYETAILQWARENGFKTEYHYNGYGVRYIRITL